MYIYPGTMPATFARTLSLNLHYNIFLASFEIRASVGVVTCLKADN